MYQVRTNSTNCIKGNAGLCVPPDASEEYQCCADRLVSPGALPRHQLCCPGDQGCEEQAEGRKQGRVCKITFYC